MLINLSYNPSTYWESVQLEEAKNSYGRIIDIPFPIISPTSKLKEVKQLAKDYLERIKSIIEFSKDTNKAVHIMGEQTFTFVLLCKLKELNIKAVSSTTVKVQDKNLINSKSEFVFFREYY
ncbi:MAG: CRISPR-associated protein [Bacteroidota bacterium]|nr:CRISPR-associated protein [Bacteroidota bacterium]